MCTVDLYLALSFASNSNSSHLIVKLFRSRLHTSLKRNFGRPRLRLPTTNSPYNWDFGIRSAPILRTWPRQQSLRWLRIKYMVVRLERLLVGDLVLPCNSKNATKASWAKSVNYLLPARKTTTMFNYRIAEYCIHRNDKL